MGSRPWLACAALLLVSAGCLGGQGDADLEDTGGEASELPAPMHEERHVEAGASPVGSAQGAPCQTQASTCYPYPFDLGADARVQAHLDWTNRTNDFDLHVVDAGGQQVASSNAGPVGTSERIDAELDPGSYELVVVAWIVTSDTYRLEAHFGYP